MHKMSQIAALNKNVLPEFKSLKEEMLQLVKVKLKSQGFRRKPSKSSQ